MNKSVLKALLLFLDKLLGAKKIDKKYYNLKNLCFLKAPF